MMNIRYNNTNDPNDLLQQITKDPNDLLQQNNMGNIGTISNPPMLNSSNSSSIVNGVTNYLANNPITEGVLGAGDSIRNLYSAGLLPAKYRANSGGGNAYDAGNIGGNIGGFIGGGEILDTLRMLGGTQDIIPLASKIAKMLEGDGVSGVARRAVGTALGGAIASPDDREMGAATGLGASIGLDALPGAASMFGNSISKVKSLMNPVQHSVDTLAELGSDAGLTPDEFSSGNAVETNGKLLANNIRDSFSKNSQESSNQYDNIFSDPNLSNSRTVHQIGEIPGVISGSSEISQYQNAVDGSNPYKINSLNELHNKYIKNPTLRNAQNLQSELGKEGAYIQRKINLGTADDSDRSNLYLIGKGRAAAKNDIVSTINRDAPYLNGAYENATSYFNNNIVPYYATRDLKDIAEGRITNPSNYQINNIFSNPEGNISKVVSDIGNQGQSQILFNSIGKLNKSNLTPQKLISSNESLDEKGLGSYRTQNFKNNINLLSKKIGRANLAERIAGLTTGALVGSHFSPELAEGFGALGMLGAPKILKAVASLPLSKFSETGDKLSKLSSSLYNFLGRGTVAAKLPENQ